MTSCRTERVASDILSNSSMQHTPPSESTSAPLDKISDGRSGRRNLRLEDELLRVGISCHVGRETNSRRTLA